MRTLSSQLIQSLSTKANLPVIGTKINGQWNWTKKQHLLHSINYCHQILKDEHIQKGDRIAYKGNN